MADAHIPGLFEHEETLSPVASRDYTRLHNENVRLKAERNRMRKALRQIEDETRDRWGTITQRIYLLAHNALRDQPQRKRSWRDCLSAWWQTRRTVCRQPPLEN